MRRFAGHPGPSTLVGPIGLHTIKSIPVRAHIKKYLFSIGLLACDEHDVSEAVRVKLRHC
jgi:hypothetical protein